MCLAALDDYINEALLTTNETGSSSKKVKNKVNPVFSVRYKNDADVIINKKTLKTEKELYIVPSKGLLLMKDVINDKIEVFASLEKNILLDKVCIKKIKEFMKELPKNKPASLI
ncbi:MAG: hypothetical protein N2749_01025 [Clostridia bacterium]|nr:hypothetical protein [Clostridia bacterium]